MGMPTFYALKRMKGRISGFAVLLVPLTYSASCIVCDPPPCLSLNATWNYIFLE